VFKGFFGKLLYRINNIYWDWKYHFVRAWRKICPTVDLDRKYGWASGIFEAWHHTCSSQNFYSWPIPVKSHGFGNEIMVSRWLCHFSRISII